MRSNANGPRWPADSPAVRCLLCLVVWSLALGCEDHAEPATHQPDRAVEAVRPAEPVVAVETPETADAETADRKSDGGDASAAAVPAGKGSSGTLRLHLSDTQEQLMLWTSSVSIPAFLDACGDLFPKEKDRYEAAIARWRGDHELAIAKGEAQMQLMIASKGLDWDGALERVAAQVRADTAELTASPRSEQKSACDLKLAILEDDG